MITSVLLETLPTLALRELWHAISGIAYYHYELQNIHCTCMGMLPNSRNQLVSYIFMVAGRVIIDLIFNIVLVYSFNIIIIIII